MQRKFIWTRPTKHWALLLIVAGGLTVPEAYGVVDAFSQANTSPPPDGAPWASVGTVNGASCVYLGGGWVLSAAHVGVNRTLFIDTWYEWSGVSHRLTNANGSITDLTLFRLNSSPPLPSMTLARTTPTALSTVDFIAYGLIAGGPQQTFGAYTGFPWSTSGAKGWGNNKVSAGGLRTINSGFGDVRVFTTDFTSPGTPGPTAPMSDEAQAAAGDSGGGVFQRRGTTWELVGILDEISVYPDQPANTAVYGNLTFSIDVATYRSQILAILAGSAVPALSIGQSGATIVVCWPDTGVAYTLESTGTLSPAVWTPVSAVPIASGGSLCVSLPAAGGPRFFRLSRN
jgi:hypothetical protein